MANWASERRLDFIDFRMVTSGVVHRADIMRTFGVSQAQASLDLNTFLRLYPGSMIYDKTIKRYTRESGYKTRRMIGDAFRAAMVLLAGHPMGWDWD